MSKWERNRVAKPQAKMYAAMPEGVPPTLRFMLDAEARDEANAFLRHVQNGFAWNSIPDHRRVDFVERHLVEVLPEHWPSVARADEAVGGLLVEVLRVFAANPKLPGWWLSPAVALSNGHPERLRESCDAVLAHAGVSQPEIESYPEERPDPVLRFAASHWQDRDLPEHEGDDV
ncbi:hypothetical protein ACFSQT_14195 [Mesorhizobium calcicola]|uniref:Uncharacterized protein n=1 Tax=Mesorhizobium calcicola TaxID=1300310 RepID=A0ABW4WF86_9HYPH